MKNLLLAGTIVLTTLGQVKGEEFPGRCPAAGDMELRQARTDCLHDLKRWPNGADNNGCQIGFPNCALSKLPGHQPDPSNNWCLGYLGQARTDCLHDLKKYPTAESWDMAHHHP